MQAAQVISPSDASGNRRPRRRAVGGCALLFALSLFGFPVVGNVISLTQVDSRLLSVPFRIGVALFSLWVIVNSGRLHADRLRQVMLLIWCFYVLRLVHDWLLTPLEGADYALQFFLACSVLPAIALMKAKVYDQRAFAFYGFAVAGLGSMMSILALQFRSAGVQDTDATSRLSLTALNAVTLGHLAVSAIFCGLALWPHAKSGGKLLLLGLAGPLMWCLVLTGSKGPALALVVCIGLWALRRGKAFRLAVIALPLSLWLLASDSSPLAARIAGSAEDESTLDRIVILTDAINQIADAPLIGSAFVELNSGFYPHNVFVEAAMAMGIPVGLAFAGLMLFGAVRAWNTLKGPNYLLGLLYFQGILGSSISGALFGSTLLWVVLAILPAKVPKAKRSRTPIQATLAPGLPQA